MAKKKLRKQSQRMVYLHSVEEIPEFGSLEEEAAFWDTHSPVEILDQLEPVTLELSPKLQRELEGRLLSLCLKPHQINQLLQIARKEGVSCLTLVKRWIEAGMAQWEAERRGPHPQPLSRR